MDLRLVRPNRRYLSSFHSAQREQSDGQFEMWPDYVRHMRRAAQGHDLAVGEVARTEYWLVNGERYLGRMQIRHAASGSHPDIESHVYYEIRPSERNKGFATKMVSLALSKAHSLGLRELIVACDAANAPSRRVIEKNGGILFARKKIPRKRTYLLFKIPLTDSLTSVRRLKPKAL